MAVQDHPRYPEWRKAQARLIEVREALRRGDATRAEAEEAQAEYDRLSAEIGI